ncbi:hypothetical protein DKX38_015916 [Salix brachista]|uniref:Uncharacterized protein n=1 Tax=Salix brachista TaxID=2182728 RepID=A0A5N5L6K3_9ROSI|nr:hypothetical protein DKX38_015916 [Salix brachista]
MIKAGITDYLAAEIKGHSSVELQFLHGSKRGQAHSHRERPPLVHWKRRATESFLSYKIVWQGQFIQPDWDMFQSDHLCAEFHAGSRAICGGPVYVSDKVGRHNSDLLKKLVLPDGNKFRCQNNALPTRDRLFDGKTLLKIWNLNRACPQCYKSMSRIVSSDVVEWEQKDRDIYRSTEKFSVYLHKSDNLSIPDSEEKMNITLQPSSFEIVTASTVQKFNERAKFAPIDIENKGAVESWTMNEKEAFLVCRLRSGKQGSSRIYSCKKPKVSMLNA